MTRCNDVQWPRSVRTWLVAAVASVGLIAAGCGGKDEDKDKGGGTAKTEGGKTGGGGKADVPKGAVTTEQTKSLSSGKTDWTKLDTKGAPTAESPKVDPGSVSKAGIVSKNVSGFASKLGGDSAPAGGFRVAYAPTEKYEHFRQAFMKEQLFEKIANTLNATIKMPRYVDIQMVDCGTVNAFYDPNNSRIIMCYELLDYFVGMFKPVSSSNEELGTAVIGATFFAFFHELGHGLIHQLDLPATGREEDAVDQLSTLILMEGGDDGVAAAMAGARWFALQEESNKATGHSMPMWDEHALEGQRFYNIACLVYGSNPEKYQPMVDNKYLPEQRAVRCTEEFGKTSRAWENLLKAHLKEGGGDDDGGGYQAPPEIPTAEEPAEPTPQPLAQGGGEGAGCDELVTRAFQIAIPVLLDMVEKQNGKPAREAAEQELRANITIIYQQALGECAGWNDQQKACVAKAGDIQALSGCGVL